MRVDSAEQKPRTRPSGLVRGAHQHHWFRRLLTRVGWTLLVVWSAVSLTFVLSRVIPADPARLAAGMGAGAEQVAEVRRQLGLDLPVWQQYINYLSGIVRLDFGDSVQSRQPVLDDIVRFFPATLELVLPAMFIYAIVGISLGVAWAMLSEGWRSRMLAGLSILGAALPVFWTGLLLQLTLASGLGWLPVSGSLSYSDYGLSRVTGFTVLDSLIGVNTYALGDAVSHLILPVSVLVLSQLGIAMRLTRSTVGTELTKNYVRVARARGKGDGRVVLVDVLRNSLAPVITMLGLQFGWMLGGTIIVEVVFSWPGLGTYAYNAFRTFDYNPILGVTLIVTLTFVLVNELTDEIIRWIDPRVRELS